MSHRPLKIAVVGCGNIAPAYANTLRPYRQIELLGATDVSVERATAFVKEFGGVVYPSLDALLADPNVELVVNLTIHHAHAAVIEQCLRAGKHVYSEKPLALTYGEAKGLVALAQERGLRLSCAPITSMGEAQQTAWKMIREGRLGQVRLVYAEVNQGRIETWHPAPAPFYEVGVLFDVGVYPLTLLTTIFGPARRVSGYATMLAPERVASSGARFVIETPDYMLATIELDGGQVVRLTANFYVGKPNRQHSLDFHGDLGSLSLESWVGFDAPLAVAAYNGEWEPVEHVREAYAGVEWGRGIVDLAAAIRAGRPACATGEQAAHVVEIIESINASTRHGRPVTLSSTFAAPAPQEWA